MTNIFKLYTIKVEADTKTKIYYWTLFAAMFSLSFFDMFFSEVKQIEIVHYLFVGYSVCSLSIIYETVVNIWGSDGLLDGVFEFFGGIFQIILSCFVPFFVFLLCKANGWTDTSSLSFLILVNLSRMIKDTEVGRFKVSIFKEG